jgi:hypothetical protein
VLLRATLQAELARIVPMASEVVSIQAIADAYATYAAGATANGVPLTPLGVAAGRTAMLAALAGLGRASAGASVLTTGLQAFWGAVALGLATSFPAAIAILPPPHAGVSGLLMAAFVSNTSSKADRIASLDTIAGILHTAAVLGGTVTYPPSLVTPIL